MLSIITIINVSLRRVRVRSAMLWTTSHSPRRPLQARLSEAPLSLRWVMVSVHSGIVRNRGEGVLLTTSRWVDALYPQRSRYAVALHLVVVHRAFSSRAALHSTAVQTGCRSIHICMCISSRGVICSYECAWTATTWTTPDTDRTGWNINNIYIIYLFLINNRVLGDIQCYLEILLRKVYRLVLNVVAPAVEARAALLATERLLTSVQSLMNLQHIILCLINYSFSLLYTYTLASHRQHIDTTRPLSSMTFF